jgi:hypothetical protein
VAVVADNKTFYFGRCRFKRFTTITKIAHKVLKSLISKTILKSNTEFLTMKHACAWTQWKEGTNSRRLFISSFNKQQNYYNTTTKKKKNCCCVVV